MQEIGKKVVPKKMVFSKKKCLRSWINAANLRIDDIRKMDFLIDISNRVDIGQIEFKMTKSEFVWGATMDKMMMGGEV